MKFIYLFLSAVVSLAFAEAVFIQSPYENVQWAIGQNETVTWALIAQDSNATSFTVDLLNGPFSAATFVYNLAINVNPQLTRILVTVPMNISSGSGYFIRVSAVPSYGESSVSFSSRFGIVSQLPPSPIIATVTASLYPVSPTSTLLNSSATGYSSILPISNVTSFGSGSEKLTIGVLFTMTFALVVAIFIQ